MRWKLAALLVVLSMSIVAASSHDLTPTEALKVRVYDSKPLYEVPRPTIYENRLYVIGGQGDTLIAMNLNGEKLWAVKIGARVSTPPLVVPDAYYGYAKKESWVIVATNSFELRAYNSVAGELRIERLRLPSVPSGSSMTYLKDGKTVVVPLTSSLQAVNLVSKSTSWSVDLGFRIRRVHYVDGGAVVYGDAKVAYVDLNSRKTIWTLELGENIAVAGDDQSFIGVVLQNGTMVSIRTSTGEPVAKRDMTEVLGYEFPKGSFPVLNGIGALTSSNEAILFVNLSDLSVSRPIRTWLPPVYQPVAAGRALLYFSKSGKVRVYHYTNRFFLSEFKVSNPPFSSIEASAGGNHSTIVSYIDEDGELHVLKIPDHWIKVQEVEPRNGGYLVEGFVCSTAPSGGRNKIVLYAMSQQGEVMGEKTIGFLDPGQCGARFSTMLRGKGALGLIVGGETIPPNVPIGLTREEWISLRGGAAVTTATTTTATRPAARPKLSFQAPPKLVVGDTFELKITGINSWNVSELTFTIGGSTLRGESVERKISPGSGFSVSIRGRAINPGTGAVLYVKHGAEVLHKQEIPLKVERGRVIEEIRAPKEARVNNTIVITVKLVNRFKDNAQFILVASLDGSLVERKVGPLRAGAGSEEHVKITPKRTGDLRLRVQVLAAGGKIVDKKVSTITVTPVPPSTPPTATTQQSALPIPLEYLVGGIIGAVLIMIAAALILGSRKPSEVEMEEVQPIPVPPIEEKEEGARGVEVPSVITPPEIEHEEVGIEVPKVHRLEMEKEELPELEEEERVVPPEVGEEIPAIKPGAEEEREVEVPEEVRESLERELESVKNRLDEVRRSISKLEEIVGFELSPYRLVDAETMLVSAELKLKEGDVREAERIINSVKESLDVLEAEVSEAEKVFLENWSAVENRIDIMLRVWGKAPANMLTMVPAGFRIHALERFRKLHPDRKLELRGDELISLEE